jgi:rhodanese-related sulfurtransferase
MVPKIAWNRRARTQDSATQRESARSHILPFRAQSRCPALVPLILKAVVILSTGSGAGLVYNAFSTAGIPLRTPVQPSFEEQISWSLHIQGLRVALADARQAFDHKEATFIDARSPRDYAAGHIPGALNLPVSEFESRSREVFKHLPKDARIITYCAGESCQSSILLARMLIEKLGYSRTQVFFDGWHAWGKAGYPFVTGDSP